MARNELNARRALFLIGLVVFLVLSHRFSQIRNVGAGHGISLEERAKIFEELLSVAVPVPGEDKMFLDQEFMDVLNKKVYGINEFEKQRDKERAERGFRKVINDVYATSFYWELSKYDFSRNGFSLGPYRSPHLILNRQVTFPLIPMSSNIAEKVRNQLQDKRGITGQVLIRFTGEVTNKKIPWSNTPIYIDMPHAVVLDARLYMPEYGYVYME